MLSENQIKRTLAHCEKEERAMGAALEGKCPECERARNKGWCQALRLVLEQNTHPISNKPLEDNNES